MQSFMKVSIFFCLCFVLGTVSAAKKRSPNKTQLPPCAEGDAEHFHELISGILPFNEPKVPPPEKLEDIPEFCQYYSGVLNEIEQLNKRCMKESHRSMFALIIYNIKRGTKSICSKKAIQSKKLTPAKKRFLELSRCVNSGKPLLKKCSDSATLHLLAIESADKKERMPMICCEILKIKDCAMDALQAQPGCDTPDFEEKLQTMIRENGGGGTISQVCQEYSTEEKCANIKLPEIKKGQKIPPSFISPLMKILGDLE